MPMNYASRILTSILGSRMGLSRMSSAQTGSARGEREYLVGPDAFRNNVVAETTGTVLPPDGLSRVNGTSAASSAVYVLDPPIPGVMKFLSFESTSQGPIYVRTANSETFVTTQGTSATTVRSTGNQVGLLSLIGLTTALWGVTAGLSTATFSLTTTT